MVEFLLTPRRAAGPTQTRDAMPLPLFSLACRPTDGASLSTGAATLVVLKEIDAAAAKQVMAVFFLFLSLALQHIAHACASDAAPCRQLLLTVVPCLLLFGVASHAKRRCRLPIINAVVGH